MQASDRRSWYDANRLRCELRAEGTTSDPGRRSRKRPICHDARHYRDRLRIEAAFYRLNKISGI
jgi:hypothetical protein